MAFSERIPPQNIEAEQSVLGACLIDKDVLPKVLHLLRPDDFYSDKHRTIYEAIRHLYDRREPVDLVTVPAHLSTKAELDQVGGLTYLTSLINMVPTTANAEAHARLVRDKADLRRLQNAARLIVDRCYTSETLDEARSDAVHLISQAVFNRESSREMQLGPALIEYVEELINTQKAGEEPKTLVKTGFKIQDDIMPLARGETTVFVAQSNIGKTTYEKALQVQVARVEQPGTGRRGRVKGYSLEMSPKQLLQKYLGLLARLNVSAIRKGQLTEDDLHRALEAATRVLDVDLYFEPRPRMRWADIKVDAMAFAARHGGLDLITVDYIQILGDPPPKNGRRDFQLGEIVEDAKALAVELDCHVAFLAQQRVDKRKPVGENEDVAESRDIVRAADNVLFLTRPTEFDPSAEFTIPVKTNEGWVNKTFKCGEKHPVLNRLMFENVMLGFLGKQRMGQKTYIPYYFEAPTGIVCDLATPWPWNNPRGIQVKQEVPDW